MAGSVNLRKALRYVDAALAPQPAKPGEEAGA